MEFLRDKIKQEFNLECYMPANGETCLIPTPHKFTYTVKLEDPTPSYKTAEKLLKIFQEKLTGWTVLFTDGAISVESVLIKVEGSEHDLKSVYISWTNQDEELGMTILEILQSMGHELS
ncbi:unnamed protein product [Nesidiocoris tenuis]|uniref:Integrator complex subunit 11 C-terminal domain-containing protein n=1 Tax=Nesidiocoris tenuis TaxID=355587 RepID=A0A6H5H6Z2_9HEMI|nr:unnamed protein product [Nesidiocoris tenuis]